MFLSMARGYDYRAAVQPGGWRLFFNAACSILCQRHNHVMRNIKAYSTPSLMLWSLPDLSRQ
jgi:hypothetical protein